MARRIMPSGDRENCAADAPGNSINPGTSNAPTIGNVAATTHDSISKNMNVIWCGAMPSTDAQSGSSVIKISFRQNKNKNATTTNVIPTRTIMSDMLSSNKSPNKNCSTLAPPFAPPRGNDRITINAMAMSVYDKSPSHASDGSLKIRGP